MRACARARACVWCAQFGMRLTINIYKIIDPQMLVIEPKHVGAVFM